MSDVQAAKPVTRWNLGWWIIGTPVFYVISFFVTFIVTTWLDHLGYFPPALQPILAQIFFPFVWFLNRYDLGDNLANLFRILLP